MAIKWPLNRHSVCTAASSLVAAVDVVRYRERQKGKDLIEAEVVVGESAPQCCLNWLALGAAVGLAQITAIAWSKDKLILQRSAHWHPSLTPTLRQSLPGRRQGPAARHPHRQGGVGAQGAGSRLKGGD